MRCRSNLRMVLICSWTVDIMSQAEKTAFDLSGWRRRRGEAALSDVHRSIPVPAGTWRKAAAFLGPGYIYGRRRLYGPWKLGNVDRGGIEVRLHAASRCACLQHHGDRASVAMRPARHRLRARPRASLPGCLSALGVVSAVVPGRDRDYATDIAEVIGTAIGLNLLFGIPLEIGVVITSLDVFLILWWSRSGPRPHGSRNSARDRPLCGRRRRRTFMSQPSCCPRWAAHRRGPRPAPCRRPRSCDWLSIRARSGRR